MWDLWFTAPVSALPGAGKCMAPSEAQCENSGGDFLSFVN